MRRVAPSDESLLFGGWPVVRRRPEPAWLGGPAPPPRGPEWLERTDKHQRYAKVPLTRLFLCVAIRELLACTAEQGCNKKGPIRSGSVPQ